MNVTSVAMHKTGPILFTRWKPFQMYGKQRRGWICDGGVSVRAFGNMYSVRWCRAV